MQGQHGDAGDEEFLMDTVTDDAAEEGEPQKPTRRSSNVRKQLVRDRMLEKSAELFCANGLSNTSINDIADALSLKRSSVYHYFQNKDEIVKALFVDEYARRCNELLELFARKELTAFQRLELAVEGAITKRLQGGSRFLVFDRLEAEVPNELRVTYNKARRRILDLYVQLVSDGIASGDFRAVDPQMAAFALIGMSNWTALWYSPRGRLTPNQIAKVLVDLFVHGVSKRAGGRENPESLAAAIDLLRGDLANLERLAGTSALSRSEKRPRAR
jgi:AcrR family transcriptional regulator